jgi:hypothetical protein
VLVRDLPPPVDAPVARHDGYRAYLPAGEKRLGLTTRDEQGWCRWYGEAAYDGRGAVVEWGAWLGSLTASYCEGLLRNPRVPRGRTVAYAYDLFRWEPWCEEQVRGTEHEGKLAVGEPFADYFRHVHAAYAGILEVRAADLATCAWDGGDIQLVVNDAVKTLAIGENVFRAFLPALLPGAGLLANQDHLWPTDAFLAVLLYLARDCFAFEYAVPDSCMVVFRCRRAVDPGLVRVPHALADVDRALLEDAFAWSRATVRTAPPPMLDLGHATTLWQAGHREDARRLVRDARLAETKGPAMYDFQLDVLRQWGYGELLDGER